MSHGGKIIKAMKIVAKYCQGRKECSGCPIYGYCNDDPKYWEYAKNNIEENENKGNKKTSKTT